MCGNKIQVFINGKKTEIKKNRSLFILLETLKISNNGIAIELNFSVVPKSQYKNIIIKKNDKVEIVHFIGGG